MRKTLPVVIAAAAMLALAGCSSTPAATPSATPAAAAAGCANTPSGAQSESVKVSGDFAKTPTVTVKAPLKVTKTQRTVLIKGKGATAAPKTTVDIALAAYDGTTGKKLMASGFDGSATMPVPVDDTKFIPGLVRTIECLPIGSRVVSTSTAKAAFGAGGDPTSLGLKTTDSVVFIADLVDALPTKATGVDQKPTPGFPTVTLDATGKPTVTIPKTAAPTKTEVAVLKKGDGPTVADGDTVTVQYQGTIWKTGKVFDESWGKTPASFPTSSVVKGFAKALVGQKVGSQVIAVIPPADGYGKAGNKAAGISGTDTLVFVVDILKTDK